MDGEAETRNVRQFMLVEMFANISSEPMTIVPINAEHTDAKSRRRATSIVSAGYDHPQSIEEFVSICHGILMPPF